MLFSRITFNMRMRTIVTRISVISLCVSEPLTTPETMASIRVALSMEGEKGRVSWFRIRVRIVASLKMTASMVKEDTITSMATTTWANGARALCVLPPLPKRLVLCFVLVLSFGRSTLGIGKCDTGISYSWYLNVCSTDGRGRYVRADGSVYEGEWHKGMRKGFGRQTYANGDVIEAKWKNDRYAFLFQ